MPEQSRLSTPVAYISYSQIHTNILANNVGTCWPTRSSLNICSSVVFPALSRPKNSSLPDFFHKPRSTDHQTGNLLARRHGGGPQQRFNLPKYCRADENHSKTHIVENREPYHFWLPATRYTCKPIYQIVLFLKSPLDTSASEKKRPEPRELPQISVVKSIFVRFKTGESKVEAQCEKCQAPLRNPPRLTCGLTHACVLFYLRNLRSPFSSTLLGVCMQAQ